MKSKRTILLALAGILLFTASFAGATPSANQRDDFPCDPTPGIVRACVLRGGHFDFSQCRCVFP